MRRFIINGRLVSLNDYVGACRTNKHVGAKMKKLEQKKVVDAIRKAGIVPVDEEDYPAVINISWYEKDKRRDVDNIGFAKKFILDALVETGVLADDSQKYVKRVTDTVRVSPGNPRIEVTIGRYYVTGTEI